MSTTQERDKANMDREKARSLPDDYLDHNGRPLPFWRDYMKCKCCLRTKRCKNGYCKLCNRNRDDKGNLIIRPKE